MRRWLALAVTAALALGCERSRPRAVDAGARPAVTVRDVPAPTVETAAVDAGATGEVDAGAARRVVVTACGDLPLSPSVFEAIRRGADGRLLTALGPVSPLLGEEAIAFGDLRGVLMARPTGGYTAGLENARALARLGFDALQLATDHALEGGVVGLFETLTAVRAAGVGVAGACEGGAGVCPPAVVERAGARVAFMGATARVAGHGADDPTSARVDRVGATNEALLAAVRDARAEADVLVFGLHVGRERPARENRARRELVDALIDAGADLVVITGPERVGLVERRESPRGDAAVAWSMGSLVSSYGAGFHAGVTPAMVASNPWVYDVSMRDGAVLHASFDLSTPGRARLTALAANAVWVSYDEGSFRVIPARAAGEPTRTEVLARLRAAMGSAVRVRP